MKPRDLKPPFTKDDEKRILLQDGVLFFPKLRQSDNFFAFPGFSSMEVFGNHNPIYIEFCSGNGEWIADKAEENPQINWLAIEMKFKRVRKIWSKKHNRNLQNLFIVCGEGLEAAKACLPDFCAERIYVNFPDPWPKKRHAKKRLIQPPFVEQVSCLLKPKGLFITVTDDPDYSLQMIEIIRGSKRFSSLYPDPFYKENSEDYGASFFDTLWREQGRQIRIHRFERKGNHA